MPPTFIALLDRRGARIASLARALNLSSRTQAPKERTYTSLEINEELRARSIGEDSIPHISFVKRNPILFQEGAKLILKRALFMVPRLIVDVFHQCQRIGRTNRKGGIATLPCKMNQLGRLLLQPFGRRSFQSFNQIGHIRSARKFDGKMNMIDNATDAETFATSTPHHCGEIRIQLWSNGLIQNRLSIFRAKYNVDQQVAQRLGHNGDYKSLLQLLSIGTTYTWGIVPDWYSLRRLAAVCLLTCTVAIVDGCKSTSKLEVPATTKKSLTDTPQSDRASFPARPTIAPPAFKALHRSDLAFTLVINPSTSDDEVASLIWQLRDAAHASTLDTLKLSQKAVNARAPNIGFNIYRGNKCATEKYADGKPPCGDGYHAAGDYTFGSYSNRTWDTGRLIHADGSQTQLWNPDAPYIGPTAATTSKSKD